MRYVAAFVCAFTLLGCNSEVEQRRQHTLERMDYGAGTAESERVQQLVVTALEQADTTSLQSPQLVNVTMRVVPDETKRGTLGVDWISAQPDADGIRVHFGDGSQSDIPFDDVEITYNEQEAETMVLFVGNPFVEREHPNAWEKLLTDPEAMVVLIDNGKAVSNEQSIHRVEFGG
ncbi:MAG: hypothetical protein AAF710_01885 [Planctomycetota bacterium]